VAVEPRDQRRRDRGDDPGGDQRHHDRLGQRQQRHHARQEEHGAYKEPRSQTDVAEPAWCAERPGQLRGVDLNGLVLRWTADHPAIVSRGAAAGITRIA
jgi:hypothetical protein